LPARALRKQKAVPRKVVFELVAYGEHGDLGCVLDLEQSD
jgi:hypothetical protein